MQSSANHMERTQRAITDAELYSRNVTAEVWTYDYKVLSCTFFPELLFGCFPTSFSFLLHKSKATVEKTSFTTGMQLVTWAAYWLYLLIMTWGQIY